MHKFSPLKWACLLIAILFFSSCEDENVFKPQQELINATTVCTGRVVTAEPYGNNPRGTIVTLTEENVIVGTTRLTISDEEDAQTGFLLIEETPVVFETDGTQQDFQLRLAGATGEALILTCEEDIAEEPDVPEAHQQDLLTFSINNASDCDIQTLQAELLLPNGVIAPIGTVVNLLPNGIDVGGLFTYVFDTEGGTPAFVFFNGNPFQLLFEVAPTQQLRISCELAVEPLTNEITDLQAALDCDLVFLSAAYQGAPIATEVLLFDDEIILMNEQALTIDPLNGVVILVVTDQGSFSVPIAGATAGSQIFLGCEQAVSLPVVGFFHGKYSNLISSLGGTSTSINNAGSMKVFLSSGKVFLDNTCSERYTTDGIDIPIEFNAEIINDEITQYGFKLSNGSSTTQHWYEHPTGQQVNFVFDGKFHTSRYGGNLAGTPNNDDVIVVNLECS